MPSGASETNGTNNGCSRSVNSNAVTLPQEEVLRLTTLQDDETETPNEIGIDSLQQHSRRSSRTASTSKSPRSGRKKSKQSSTKTKDFEREKPKRTKSGGSTGSKELRRAVKNEKKSVNSVVAAAIRNYEEYPASPTKTKTRTAPPRTKSGSSTNSSSKKKKGSSTKSSQSDEATKKKSRKKKTAGDSQGLELAASRSSEASHGMSPAIGNNSDAAVPPTQQAPEPHQSPNQSPQQSMSMDRAGAIAVFPSDSDHATTRRSISNPHNADEMDSTLFTTNDEEAQMLTYEEEVPEPPQSQVIHAVATYQQQPQTGPASPFMRRSISEAQSSAESTLSGSLGTAPTISTTADAAGTVTARAVSSENYYAHVRQQLQEEAVAAVAVVPLNDDGRPMDNGSNKKKKMKKGFESDDDSYKATKEGQKKKVWMCCAFALLVILIAIIASVASNRLRRRSKGSDEPTTTPQQDAMALMKETMECDGGEDCMDDMMEAMNSMMNTEMGLAWRARIARILPKDTLVKILEDPTFTSPQYKAFYYIVANCDKIFGFTMRELTEIEFSRLDTSRVTTIFGLVTLYEATNGSDWFVNTNWLEPMVDICEWHGVNCQGELMENLNLTPIQNQDRGTNALSGIQPPPPGDLDDDSMNGVGEEESVPLIINEINNDPDGYFDGKILFQSLDLQANNLSGSIPEEISLMTNVYGMINLAGNNIGGSVPEEIGELSRLQALRLDGNQLKSTLPLSLGQLAELRVFDVSGNVGIEGDVAEFEWSWPHIEFLQIQRTNLYGTIPDVICDSLEGHESSRVKYLNEFIFRASCSTENPRVDCPCCTHCCGYTTCERNNM